MSYLGFSLGKNEGDGEDDDNHGDSTPFTLSFFLASNLAALHHTRRHHHEQREQAMEMGKTERGKEPQPIFGVERRGSTKTCPNLPSLLFSSSPSILSVLSIWGVAAQGGGTVQV